MAKQYSFPRKVERILKDDHGVEAVVAKLRETGEAGLRVTSGDFVEVISGAITRPKLAALAARIKAAT